MEGRIRLDPQLEEALERAAREQRRSAARLLHQVVREYLEIYEDEKLFRQMRRDARRSGYHERDAVELVRKARRQPNPQKPYGPS
jgi:hypothetical protein